MRGERKWSCIQKPQRWRKEKKQIHMKLMLCFTAEDEKSTKGARGEESFSTSLKY